MTFNQNLRVVFVLLDLRHSPTQLDKDMIEFLLFHAIPFKIIATKADKLAKSKIPQACSAMAKQLGIRPQLISPLSSENGYGIDKLLEFIGGNLEAGL